MRYTLMVLTLAGALAAPAVTFAQTSKPAPAAAKPAAVKPAAAKPASAAVHAVGGVVKSVDASTLVITRSGKKGGEMSFMLNSSTQREGTIEAGAKVSVRYHMDGTSMVANGVRAEAAKAQKTAKK